MTGLSASNAGATMKSILVHIRQDEGQRSRLEAAIAIARKSNSRLVCLQVLPCPDLFFPTRPQTSSHVVKYLIDSANEVRTREADNRKHLDSFLATEGIPFEWLDSESDTTTAIAETSRYADCAIVNLSMQARSSSEPLPILQDLILSSSIPVLAVPPALRTFDLEGTAVLAWNGSQEAARACRAALPLLHLAARIVVIAVGDASLAVSGERLCAYLHHHGIKAVLRHEKGEDAAATLLDAARDEDAAWMAAGAYGHAPWREAIFGGVTKALLTSDTRPVLFAR